MVGVVGVEHGAVVHPEREVGRVPAAAGELHVDAFEHALAVEAAAPVHAEVVALPGHRHVVVAVEADLRGTAGHVRGERGEARPLRRLRLLAAEGAAHAPALAHHRRARHPEHVRDEILDLGRMLGGRPDPHLVVLSGNRERRLPFEVEVLLAADPHPAFEPVRGGGNRKRRLPSPELVGGEHVDTGGQAVVHRHSRRDRIDLDSGTERGAAGRVAGLRHHREHNLPVKEDLAGGENRVVAEGGAAVVRAGNVRGGQHRQHPGEGAHRVEVDGADCAARLAGGAGRDVHGAGRLREVVDVGGGPPDVARGAVVGEGESDARALVEVRPIRERGVGDERAGFHGRHSTVGSGRHRAPAAPPRCRSLPARWRRRPTCRRWAPRRRRPTSRSGRAPLRSG